MKKGNLHQPGWQDLSSMAGFLQGILLLCCSIISVLDLCTSSKETVHGSAVKPFQLLWTFSGLGESVGFRH